MKVGFAALICFIGTIFAANWALQKWGVVPVGFGLMAPAGVFFVGAALTFRDVAHRTLGRWWVVAAIVVGALLSYLVAPAFALASGTAFLVSELADLSVYEPLQRRTFLGAVALSNTVGAAVDSAIFLWLAFGSLTFFWGQMVGKTWVTVAALPILLASRRVFKPVDEGAAA